eukprot:XP_028344031.1 uncharacterized protein LOC114486079 [Physeter catodon]
MATLNVQAQIRHNAETVQEYFRDLQKWRSAIKENEATAKRAEECVKPSAESPPLAANCSTAFPCKSQEDQQERQPRSRCAVGTGETTVPSTCKNKPVLARDRNSIAAYYAAWDRFDVDEELAKLDTEDSKSPTTIRQNESKTARPIEAKMDAKTYSSTTRVWKQRQSSSQQLLLEKLQTASESLDSRVKMYVRTNTTFYANQLNDIVQVRLAPLRQGVLDLSLSLMDAASSTIGITRQLNETASHVNATTVREAAQMEALRARREAAFTEALEEEEIAMQGQLVASKQREQSRVNKSSVEEQILLSAIEGAVDDLKKRGFAVLDFSAVYPESEARKVLDVTLYFTDLQTRPHGWEVLPIVVVPSSGFLGHIDIPQTASEWLTSILASADGMLPTTRTNSVVSGGGIRRLVKQKQQRIHTRPRKTQVYRRGVRTRLPLAAGLDERHGTGSKSTLHGDAMVISPAHVGTTNKPVGVTGSTNNPAEVARQGDRAKGPSSQGEPTMTSIERESAAARASATAGKREGREKHGAYPTRRHYGSAGSRRLGIFEANTQRYFSRVEFPRKEVSAASGACGCSIENKAGLGDHGYSSQLEQREPRRLSVLEGPWTGRFSRVLRQGRTPRILRTAPQHQQRKAQPGTGQPFSAPQLILGENYPDEDEVEIGRKWQATVLRKTQAVVAAWWGDARQSRGKALESRERRSILPPTYTLQQLVRDHFESLPTKPKGADVPLRGRESHFTGSESTRRANEGPAGQSSVNAHSSASMPGASGMSSSQSTTLHGQKKDAPEQAGVFGNRLGYYVLRAEQILLEGFYVAPGGEVSSVRLRYPPLRDLGTLVPPSQYGVRLLRQLATSLYAKLQLRKSCPRKSVAAAASRFSPVAGENELINSRAAQPANMVGQALASDLQADVSRAAQLEHRIPKEKGEVPGNTLGCSPANYNPFLRCLTSRHLSRLFNGGPRSATVAAGTGEPAALGRRFGAPSTPKQDQSHLGVSGDYAGPIRAEVRRLQEQSGLRAAATGRAAGHNYEEHADVQSP